MTRLIDADSVEKVLTDLYIKRPLDSDRWVIGAIESGIRKLPTIDAVPLRIGSWEPYCLNLYKESWNVIRCSGCHKIAIDRYNYCPHCGAKMENAREDGKTD